MNLMEKFIITPIIKIKQMIRRTVFITSLDYNETRVHYLLYIYKSLYLNIN